MTPWNFSYTCTLVHLFRNVMVNKKNSAYGRQRISRPMQIVGSIQFWRGCVIYLFKKMYFFFVLEVAWYLYQRRRKNLIMWPKGQWEASKNLHEKGTTDRHTLRLYERIGQRADSLKKFPYLPDTHLDIATNRLKWPWADSVIIVFEYTFLPFDFILYHLGKLNLCCCCFIRCFTYSV